ncbi:MAG: 2-O-(6-phospho-alpha-D-mannosyl)-D-glycerate hydrolase [Actinomycetota bacterium]
MPRRVATVPHTHWDREWQQPFAASRLALVALLDDVLPRLEQPFLLDGQIALVDDYLEVRPEAAPLVQKRIAEGLLSIGPWYVQPDEFQVSGETLVRNLELGLARATELGAPMAVGYLPDSFGHVAQMPQLLRGAGIGNAVVWRGVPAAVRRSAFAWEGPDGSVVRAEYLPVGYGNGAALPRDPDAILRRVQMHEAELDEWWLGDMLLMAGTDRSRPDPVLPRVLADANAMQSEYRFRITTLEEYLASAPVDGLGTWRGELRSASRAPVLAGVLSNRLDLKQAAAATERALERRAEPLAALFAAPEAWPGRVLELAWLDVVRNAAHDSISGCSVDEVGDAVLARYASARQAADAVSAAALDEFAASLADVGPVVVNLSSRPRGGLVEYTELGPPQHTVRRLTGADLSQFLQRREQNVTVMVDGVEVTEPVRRELFARAGAERGASFEVVISRRAARTALARVDRVPPYGWARLTPTADAVEPPVVEVDPTDGTVTIDGARGLDRLVDEEDLGDTYTASPASVVFEAPTHVEVLVVENGPLRRRVRVVREHDGGPTVTTLVETRAGERVVRFTTTFENRRSGHRLRTWFPLPTQATHSYAECAFAVVRRGLAAEGGPYERAATTFPSRRFVSAGGLTIVHDGLPEYQLVAGGRALALTLLRSVEWISRPGNPHRPVPAGPEVQVQGPARMGTVVARYAVQVGAVDPYELADDVLVPLEVVDAPGGGWRASSGQTLDAGTLEVSSVRRTGEGLDVRVFNPSPEPREGLGPWEIARRLVPTPRP